MLFVLAILTDADALIISLALQSHSWDLTKRYLWFDTKITYEISCIHLVSYSQQKPDKEKWLQSHHLLCLGRFLTVKWPGIIWVASHEKSCSEFSKRDGKVLHYTIHFWYTGPSFTKGDNTVPQFLAAATLYTMPHLSVQGHKLSTWPTIIFLQSYWDSCW